MGQTYDLVVCRITVKTLLGPRAQVVQGSRYHRYDIDYDIIGYDIKVHTYDIIHETIYDMTYNIIGQCAIRSTAALRRPRCGSGHAATLPRLCRPGPALAEPLCPDPLRLSDNGSEPSSLASARCAGGRSAAARHEK
jgi:hypothetical protein